MFTDAGSHCVHGEQRIIVGKCVCEHACMFALWPTRCGMWVREYTNNKCALYFYPALAKSNFPNTERSTRFRLRLTTHLPCESGTPVTRLDERQWRATRWILLGIGRRRMQHAKFLRCFRSFCARTRNGGRDATSFSLVCIWTQRMNGHMTDGIIISVGRTSA